MSAVSLAVRLVLSMAVVIALLWIAGRVVRNRTGLGPGRLGAGQAIDVLARRGLSKGASIALIRAGGRTLLVGVTDASITHLGDADDDAIEELLDASNRPPLPTGPTLGGANWRSLLDTLRERTVRRP